jgi:uncharacterized membrane protein
MEAFEFVYNLLGSLFCHQLPSRTISINGIMLPMCARDSGIYTGVFTALVYILVRKRFNSDKPPGLSALVVLCMFMIPMLVDGVGSFLGLRTSSNILRFCTGIYFGSAIPFFVTPAINFKLDTENRNPVLKGWKELTVIAAVNAALCFIILGTDLMPWLLVSSITILSFILLINRIVYMVLIRCRLKYTGIYSAGMTAGVLFIMFVISGKIH